MSEITPGQVGQGPLVGLKVLEMSGIGPGPFAASLLADLGAEVVRIDRPGGSGTGIPENSDALRRSRRSVVLDLTDERGIQALLDLVDSADALIEGYRPGVAERLGFGPDVCLERNPRLVYARMTGWGQDGPQAQTAGHDINYIAMTGVLHAMGRAGEAPAIPLNVVGDFGGGALYLVVGILGALYERERSGMGQVVDAAIVDGVNHMAALFHGMIALGMWRDERGTNILDSGAPWYDTYETADHRHMAVGAIEPKFYVELMETLGLNSDPARRNDPRNWPAIRAELTGAFAARTRDEWEALFASRDACASPVLSLAEAKEHRSAIEREAFVDVGGLKQPAPAPRFGRTPGKALPPPGLGEHTIAVLADWGLDDDVVSELIASGVAVQGA